MILEANSDRVLNDRIDERTSRFIRQYLAGPAFTGRKVSDTPTDSLSVVNRQYVTLNGTSANRPTASVIGQFYFDTTLGKPIWWNGTSFVDATGTTV